jgi:hypothetical protein
MDMSRFEHSWSDMKDREPGLVPAPGLARTLTVLFLTLGILVLFTSIIPFQYQPYDGIVGLPLLMDYSPGQELLFYLGSLLSAVLINYVILRIISRSRHPALTAYTLACLAFIFFLVIILTFHSPGKPLWLMFIGSHEAILELVLILLACNYLAWKKTTSGDLGLQSGYPGAAGLTEQVPTSPADFIYRFSMLFLYLSLVLSAFLPEMSMSAVLAFPFAWILEGLLQSSRTAKKHAHISVFLENYCWILLLLLPLIGWTCRLMRTLDFALPGSRTMTLISLGTVLLTIICGIYRKRLGFRPQFKIHYLFPALLLGLILIGSGTSDQYDAFHQGEFTYPARALLAGLYPWQDIFYVHGFGINTLFGLIMGEPSIALHSLDSTLYSVLAGISLAVISGILVKLWGTDWWMTILAICICCLLATGPLGARFLFIWIQFGFILNFIRKGRLRWLFGAAIAASLNLFYSLDTGAVACICGFAWCFIWDWIRNWCGSSGISRLLPGRCTAAYTLGFVVMAVISAVGFFLLGILDDVVSVHWEYLRMKHHYDKIPFNVNSVAFLISPVVSYFGICTSIQICMKRDLGPLAGSTILFTLLSIVCFARGLDRADAGHLIYATSPAWVLAGNLLVRRRIASPDPTTQTGGKDAILTTPRPGVPVHSCLFAVMLCLYPVCHPLLTGGRSQETFHQALSISPITSLRFLQMNRNQPFCLPVRDPESIDFFNLCSDINIQIPVHEGIYDFSNQPAVYTWTNRLSPTRFFAPFYTASMHWQTEVISQLVRKNVRYIIWRGPSFFWNQPDGIPNYLRQWWIARYILRNYRPFRLMSGNTLILERDDRSGSSDNDPDDQTLYTDKDRHIDLQRLPLVLGRSDNSRFPRPDQLVMRASSQPDEKGIARLNIQKPGLLPLVDEIWITFHGTNHGRQAVFKWSTVDPDSTVRPFEISFFPDVNTPGPYRIPLSCIPGWVWTVRRDDNPVIEVSFPGQKQPVDFEMRSYSGTIG